VYCNACGKVIPDDARLCSYCGQAVQGPQGTAGARSEWVRPQLGRRIAGVCLGVARHFGWNVTTIRIVWLLLFLFGGTGGLLYLILWVVMPNEA
jgi:phage shock protein PspC (stress-responsive transcriptional regulator)